MQHLRSFAAFAAALLFVATPLTAQDDWGRGGFEISAAWGVLNGYGNEYMDLDPVALQVDNDQFLVGRLGYVFTGGFGLEGYFGYLKDAEVQTPGLVSTEPSIVTSGGGPEATVLNYGVDMVINLQPEQNFQVFLMAGAGQQRINVGPTSLGDAEQERYAVYNYGGGVKLFITRNLALRTDYRQYIAPDGPEATRRFFNPGAEFTNKALKTTEWTVGLSLFAGGPADEDGDGVPDERDLCPGTPDGVAVDGDGCPFDDDGDGVYNYMDDCPDTPAGAVVDANGCPTDADGDGVWDGIDQCDNTPAGAVVDANGCPSDSDGDGVFDGIDQCDGTPSGAVVDANGCPSDEDGDGVLDGIDQCPGTPAGREVDAEGCGEFQAALAQGRLVISGVQFAFNSAELREGPQAALTRAAGAIRNAVDNNPGLTIEVQGHTDSIGSERYNQGLSERRAASVRDFIVGLDASLASILTTAGYGESQPIASNDTDEGRAQNRRVEFVVNSD